MSTSFCYHMCNPTLFYTLYPAITKLQTYTASSAVNNERKQTLQLRDNLADEGSKNQAITGLVGNNPKNLIKK